MSGGEEDPRPLGGLSATSLAARLRPLLPAIDEAVRAGVRHHQIVEHLASQGLEVGLLTFRSSLYRFRKQQRREAPQEAPLPPPRELPLAGDLLTEPASPERLEQPVNQNSAGGDASVAEALDPASRKAFSDQYFNRPRRPRFGPLAKGDDE